MSILKVSNIHLEPTGNTRIEYADGNNIIVTANSIAFSGSITTDGNLPLTTTQSANLRVGFTSSSVNNGIVATGTFTPNIQSGAFQHYFNNGAHNLAPPTDTGSLVLDVINQGSAGVINTNSFTKVTGDAFSQDNANEFRLFITVSRGKSHAYIQALQ